MRRFEHPSGKFWSAAIHRQTIQIRWGKTGTHGQGRMLGFESDAHARAKLAELAAKQLAEGYVEIADPKAIIAELPKHERWSRRFERKPNDYLELTLDGKRVQKRAGTTGVDEPDLDHDLSIVEHDSEEQARSIVEALINHATANGFLLVYETEPHIVDVNKIVVAVNPELEAQCRAEPDNPAPWLVYADWLMLQGDVRGELAALRARGREREADAFLRAHRVALLGGTDLVDVVRITSWRHGFAVAAAIKREQDPEAVVGKVAELTSQFLSGPLAHYVEALRFGLAGFSNNNDWGPTLDAVIGSRVGPQIRSLRFDDYSSEDSEISWTPFGDFSHAWPELARLEELVIRSGAGGELGTIVLPALKKFVRISGGLKGVEIDAICNATWPALEHLEMWFGASQYGAEGDVTRIRPILDGVGLPKLRHLGIVNCEFVDSAIEPLAGSKLLPQLRTLDLSSGIMAARATKTLIEHAAAFRHLDAIELDRNLLVPSEVAQLKKALPNVKIGKQRERDDDEDADPEDDYRYVALGE